VYYGALAWFIDRDKLYTNIMLKEGENKVGVKFSYTPPKKVYATVNATNLSVWRSLPQTHQLTGPQADGL
jgi:hypothetical protein